MEPEKNVKKSDEAPPRNRTLKNGLPPVALRAPSRRPFLSESLPPQGVLSVEATYQ